MPTFHLKTPLYVRTTNAITVKTLGVKSENLQWKSKV